MKTTKHINKLAIAVAVLFFLVLWGVWYSFYYYTLCWQEGFAFFSTLSDFTDIQVNLPEDIFKYIGAYILQFFRNPLYGAAIQAGFAAFIVACIGISIKDIRLLWMAFIPIPILVAGQYADIMLERSVLWCSVALLIAIVWGGIHWMKFKMPIPKWLRSPILMFGVPMITLGVSIYLLLDRENEYQEKICQIDYCANRQEWPEVLQLIPPQEAKKDDLKLRYALLALSETGQLADRAFGYGIQDYSQFLFYGSEDPFSRNFNALFYQALGLSNEVIHQCYQQSLTSPFGFNFKSLRMLVDTCLETGDYILAKKYLEVLRHSSFHQEWIEDRMEKMGNIKKEDKPVIKEEIPFVGNFLETITSLVNQDQTNKKQMDLCLCAILTTRNAEYFHQAFQIAGPIFYANGKRIPRHYEEALLLIALRDKNILSQYNISQESKARFADFMQLYQNGRINAAKAKYPESYWSFVF